MPPGKVPGGGVSERPKEHASKACVGSRPPWVQIPPPPPLERPNIHCNSNEYWVSLSAYRPQFAHIRFHVAGLVDVLRLVRRIETSAGPRSIFRMAFLWAAGPGSFGTAPEHGREMHGTPERSEHAQRPRLAERQMMLPTRPIGGVHTL